MPPALGNIAESSPKNAAMYKPIKVSRIHATTTPGPAICEPMEMLKNIPVPMMDATASESIVQNPRTLFSSAILCS